MVIDMNKRFGRFLATFTLIILSIVAVLIVSGCNQENIELNFKEYEEAGGKVENLKKAAVLEFSGKTEGTNEELSRITANGLRKLGYMEILDSDRIQQILRDKGLPTEGVISTEEAGEIAKALGVDLLVYGKAYANFDSRIDYYDRYGYRYHNGFHLGTRYHRRYYPVYRIPYLHRSGRVEMNLHFFDARLGKEMGNIKLGRVYSKNFKEFYYSRHKLDYQFYFDRLKNMPMPSDRRMILLIAQRLTDEMIDRFTPYLIDRVRKLAEDVPGYQLAVDDRWDEAAKVWKKSISRITADWKLYLNLGIYYERRGNPARALEYYRKSLKIKPENETLQQYANQAKKAKQTRLSRLPMQIDPGQIKYRVADVKDDGRIYITAGKEDGVKPGDTFTIARSRVEMEEDLVTPRETHLFPVATLTIEKVFEGVSYGTRLNQLGYDQVEVGDVAVNKQSIKPVESVETEEETEKKESPPKVDEEMREKENDRKTEDPGNNSDKSDNEDKSSYR